jgi:acyl-CoA reductase-like NAD-dependent aldehyde dehydrogenase
MPRVALRAEVRPHTTGRQRGVTTSVLDPAAALEEVRTHDWRMLLAGELRHASGGATYPTENPATEERLAEVPDATPGDVAEAVAAAKAAGLAWAALSVRDRATYIRRASQVIAENAEELAFLDSIDTGNPITAMRGDVNLTLDLMQVYTEWGMELKGETIPASADHLHYTVREPYGVVARIVPYNHPLMFTAARSVAPLIAGNTVVVKAPDQTPLSPLRLSELLVDVLPPGVLTILTGGGAISGDALVRHPDVRRIAFIGSPGTGRAIQRAAAESAVKNVTLELGGKNPMIVFPDADLDAAVKGAVLGMNFHWTGGQSCGSTSRLLLHESLADELLPRIAAEVESIRIGTPMNPESEMGSMVSKAQYDKVMQYIESGKQEGARLLTGGGRPEGPEFERGYFISPTVFVDVRPEMRIAQEEIFGPVLSVLTWSDEAELMEIANGVEYGLTASVWTKDLATAHRVAGKAEAGFVWINSTSRHFPGAPFGGYKESGVGREEGLDEVLGFTQTKTINLKLA